jgi:hypothetical protein
MTYLMHAHARAIAESAEGRRIIAALGRESRRDLVASAVRARDGLQRLGTALEKAMIESRQRRALAVFDSLRAGRMSMGEARLVLKSLGAR